jgi:hypothetical protein
MNELFRRWGVLSIVVAAQASAASSPAPGPAFTPVQPELFAKQGALASAWADFDGDGDVDLAVSFGTGELRLYRNDKGVFTNVGPDVGFPTQGAEMRGLAWGDYDNDGDVDLYAATSGRGGTVGRLGETIVGGLLFRNDNGRFTEVAKAAGVAAPGPNARQANWIDYDNDGDLDLFVTQRASSNRLLRNDGGTFVDVSGEAKINDPRRSVGACWFDFDQDGDLDVFVANQQGDKDGFYRNDGGVFTDIAGELNIQQPNRSLEEGGVNCAVGDYDNDGDFDLYVTVYGANILYRNDGGKFRDVAQEVGITGDKMAVGVNWGDYDNDGLLDLVIAGYERENGKYRSVDHLLRNTGGRFVEMLAPGSALHAGDHAALWADYDNDGDLDLSFTEAYNPAGHHLILRNDLPAKPQRYSLLVQVLDREGHLTRAGSEVRLYDAKGALLASRLVSPTEGYDSQSAMPVHFGLPGNAPVTVEVTYLTEAGRKQQRVENVKPAKWAGRWLVVKEAP